MSSAIERIDRAVLTDRCTMRTEPSRTMRADGFEWDHTIQVALPPSYDRTERDYPVFWVTDGNAYFGSAVDVIHWFSAVGLIPEMIVVGVGPEPELEKRAAVRRRNHDYTPTAELFHDGLGGDLLRRTAEEFGLMSAAGGASGFLDFLVDRVRPALAAEYRMDAGEHALFGHSGGGTFVGYALFARPGAFSRYVCGSPGLNTGNFEIFKLEERYAATHDDLPARVFFGAGEREIDDLGGAMWSFVGSMVRLAETLRLRNYPSLQVTSRIFPGETHHTDVWPLLTWGVRALWAPEAA